MSPEKIGKTEDLATVETEMSHIPSTLTLFSCNGAEYQKLKSQYETGNNFKREFHAAQGALDRLGAETNNHIQKITQEFKELTQEADNLVSSKTCSLAYLEMLNELSHKGFSPEEIIELFECCVKVNTA
ncbi:MAG: hypothetical protein V1808_00135, partial [Candidatus Daviesbacteria bacterium]